MIVGLLTLSLVLWLALRTPGAGGEITRVDDRAELIPVADRARFEWYLGEIYGETGLDLRLLFVPESDGIPLDRFAAREADRLRIGREDGGLRGALVVYDRSSNRIRVEVGYGLEPYLPDGFVGHLIENHADEFFRSGDVTTGLRLMIRMMHERIRDQMLGGTFDPIPFIRRDAYEHVSGGAGAAAAAPVGGAGQAAFAAEAGGALGDLPEGVRRDLGPQPTPEAAYRAHDRWVSAAVVDPHVALLTERSRAFIAGRPLTRAYADHMILTTLGKSYRIVQRGDLAMLYFTGTPLRSPMYFKRSSQGWQVDFVAELRNSRELVGNPLTWSLRDSGDEYSLAFADLVVDVSGSLRVLGGDNRPLPSRAR